MPEHAAVDTSIFNELIPQALQQTLYTKISNVQKAKSFISATLPLTSIYIFGNSWEIHVQQLEWIPFPAKSVQQNR